MTDMYASAPGGDELARARGLMKQAQCSIRELLRLHPEIIDGPPQPKAPARVHGLAPGDRVTVHVGEQYEYGNPLRDIGIKVDDAPCAYGHVADVRKGCGLICRYMCRLVTVSIEGSLVADFHPDTPLPYRARVRVDQVQHAD
jgi:hypothetical protein